MDAEITPVIARNKKIRKLSKIPLIASPLLTPKCLTKYLAVIPLSCDVGSIPNFESGDMNHHVEVMSRLVRNIEEKALEIRISGPGERIAVLPRRRGLENIT